jgi:hypothetical protein
MNKNQNLNTFYIFFEGKSFCSVQNGEIVKILKSEKSSLVNPFHVEYHFDQIF